MDKTISKYVVQHQCGIEQDGSPYWSDTHPALDLEFDEHDYKSEQRAGAAAKAYLAYEEGMETDPDFVMEYRIIHRRISDTVEDHE